MNVTRSSGFIWSQNMDRRPQHQVSAFPHRPMKEILLEKRNCWWTFYGPKKSTWDAVKNSSLMTFTVCCVSGSVLLFGRPSSHFNSMNSKCVLERNFSLSVQNVNVTVGTKKNPPILRIKWKYLKKRIRIFWICSWKKVEEKGILQEKKS